MKHSAPPAGSRLLEIYTTDRHQLFARYHGTDGHAYFVPVPDRGAAPRVWGAGEEP